MLNSFSCDLRTPTAVPTFPIKKEKSPDVSAYNIFKSIISMVFKAEFIIHDAHVNAFTMFEELIRVTANALFLPWQSN